MPQRTAQLLTDSSRDPSRSARERQGFVLFLSLCRSLARARAPLAVRRPAALSPPLLVSREHLSNQRVVCDSPLRITRDARRGEMQVLSEATVEPAPPRPEPPFWP